MGCLVAIVVNTFLALGFAFLIATAMRGKR